MAHEIKFKLATIPGQRLAMIDLLEELADKDAIQVGRVFKDNKDGDSILEAHVLYANDYGYKEIKSYLSGYLELGDKVDISIDKVVNDQAAASTAAKHRENLRNLADNEEIRLSELVIGQQARAADESLYDRLGGVFAIAAVVDHFSDALIANPIVGKDSANPALKHWHTNSLDRLPGLKFMRTLWVCTAAGGKFSYVPTKPGKTNLGLEEAHRDLKISPAEFDEVAAELGRTLDAFNVPQREKDEVLGAFSAHKDEVTAGYKDATASVSVAWDRPEEGIVIENYRVKVHGPDGQMGIIKNGDNNYWSRGKTHTLEEILDKIVKKTGYNRAEIKKALLKAKKF